MQPAYLLSGTNSNISNDMDRSLVYMGSAPMEKLLNFSFSGNDKYGYTIINQIKEQTYSYLLLVTEYMLVIVLMNCVAYFLFNKKIVE